MSIEEQDAKAARKRIAELEAQCAALRSKLDRDGHDAYCKRFIQRVSAITTEAQCDCSISPILASHAGRTLLERLERAELECDELNRRNLALREELAQTYASDAAQHFRANALEEAAKVAEDYISGLSGAELGAHSAGAIRHIAGERAAAELIVAHIRALKNGGGT